MYQVIRNYLEWSEFARTPEQLRDAVSAVIAPIDLFAFAFLAQPKSGRPLLISIYPPDWTDYYIARGYQRRDPVILHSRLQSVYLESSDGEEVRRKRLRFLP